MLGFTNAKPMAPPYDGIMLKFYAIPGASGKVRLKLEMPEDASAVMIRYKTTAWADGDGIATGTLVDHLTDNYNLANEWYEVSGLTNGTAYYFKAFPYNEVYNTTIGENETVCKAGGLVAEITADSIAGTTYNDTSGNNNNATAYSSPTAVAGLVGNAINFASVSPYLRLPNAAAVNTDQTFALFIKPASFGTYNSIFYKYYGVPINIDINSSGYVKNANAASPVSSLQLTAGNYYCLIVKYTASTNTLTIKIRKYDGVAWAINNAVISATPESYAFAIGHWDGGRTMIGQIDQFRYFNRLTTDDEDNNLFNGGDGC